MLMMQKTCQRHKFKRHLTFNKRFRAAPPYLTYNHATFLITYKRLHIQEWQRKTKKQAKNQAAL